MIPDILIILFTILNSIKIKGYHQFERKIDKFRMQVASFKTNSKTHHRIKSKYYDWCRFYKIADPMNINFLGVTLTLIEPKDQKPTTNSWVFSY